MKLIHIRPTTYSSLTPVAYRKEGDFLPLCNHVWEGSETGCCGPVRLHPRGQLGDHPHKKNDASQRCRTFEHTLLPTSHEPLLKGPTTQLPHVIGVSARGPRGRLHLHRPHGCGSAELKRSPTARVDTDAAANHVDLQACRNSRPKPQNAARGLREGKALVGTKTTYGVP